MACIMLNEKDRFDAHYKLAEFYKQVRNERRQYEWRVTLGLWLALAAGMVQVKALPDIPVLAVVLFFEFVVAYHSTWVIDNFYLRNRDANRSYAHLSRASNLAGLNKVEPPNQRWWDKYPIFETAGTILLAVGFIIIYAYR